MSRQPRIAALLMALFLPGCETGRIGDSAEPEESGLASRTRPPFDWVGIVGTGQSLSVGATAKDILDPTPSFNNLRLKDSGAGDHYPITWDPAARWTAVSLSEPPREFTFGLDTDGEYPNNLHGETPHSALANQLTVLGRQRFQADYVTAHSVVGWSGKCIRYLGREGANSGLAIGYLASLHEAAVFTRLAASAGKTFGYGGVVLTHGECDAASATYGADLLRLQREYQTALSAITGQTEPVPLFFTQQSTRPARVNGNAAIQGSAVQAWRESRRAPDALVCAGPKYQWQYSDDHLHLTSASYRALGEKLGEVFDRVVNGEQRFYPLAPNAARRTGSVITVDFHVPSPPLAFDATLPAPHQSANTEWARGRGFEVVDSSGKLRIVAVSIAGSSVQLQLAAPPPGTGLRVRYAVTQDAAPEVTRGGFGDGLIGQLRDSSPFKGASAQMFPCSVHSGSRVLDCSGADLRLRTPRDRVFGAGFGTEGTQVTALAGTTVTVASPWTGPAGTAPIELAYELRNFCVHFDIPVAN